MQKTELETIYRNHHEGRGRYGYLYCDGERIPYLKRWIGQGKQVLDLGCRDGMLTQGYAEGNQVLGVDIDQHALELAQKRLGIQTRWLDLNAEWPFANESFDVIVACEIMEHLFFLQKFIDHVHATLKPGGIFIGSVPNAFRMRNRFRFLLGKEVENDPTHVRMFSRTKLQDVLSTSFNEVEIVPLQGKILPFLPVSSKLPARLNALFAKDLLWRAVKKIV
jgi:2-polyprenyl-3-methyl-5-hydroxy-6-metoxy-1,4-benzoquinol methylase